MASAMSFRAISSSEDQSLIDELARSFVQAAVTRLLKEQEEGAWKRIPAPGPSVARHLGADYDREVNVLTRRLGA
jgi:hypothetical protein